jgi:hypothetical protein
MAVDKKMGTVVSGQDSLLTRDIKWPGNAEFELAFEKG